MSGEEKRGGLAYIVQVYSLLACISLGLFGTLHMLSGGTNLGYIELLGSCLFLLNVGIALSPRHIVLANNLFLLMVLAFLAVMLITGGTQRTGVFWFFVFPVAAFFLSGKRQGLLWMAALLAAGGVIWQLAVHGIIHIAYDSVVIGELLSSVLVVGVGVYAYQESRERLLDQSRESNRKLHSEKVKADLIVQHIGEGIVATDSEGVVTFMNPAAERLLGLQAAELVGRNFTETVPMLDQAGHPLTAENRPMARVLRTGESMTLPARYGRPDGQTALLSVTSDPISIGGKIVGGIGTLRDAGEGQKVARAESEFVTLASHQLRTPLSAVSWLSELLLSGDTGKLSPEQLEHIRDIYRSNQRMNELVSEMLIVSSLELGTLPVIPQKTDLGRLATKIVHEQLSLRKEKHHVAQHYNADVPLLLCDPDIIRLLLRNLLSNALKYTPADGKVEVRIAVDKQTSLRAGSQGSVAITVSDSGYGIPEASMQRVFTKFFRAKNIVDKDTDGTGLGLYIVKALLDYVGGRISFDSTEGKGTKFTLLLPLEGMAKRGPHARSVGHITRRGALAAGGGNHV